MRTCLTAVIIILLASCAGAPKTAPPEVADLKTGTVFMERTRLPEDAGGIWIGRAGETKYELHLYETGIALLEVRWLGGSSPHLEVGDWEYDPAYGTLRLTSGIAPDLPVCEVTGRPPVFHFEGVRFERVSNTPVADTVALRETAVGSWTLAYRSAEDRAEITLNLLPGGTFTETTRYAGGTDLLAETGTWSILPGTDILEFSYQVTSGADFFARLLPGRGIIVTPAGEFRGKSPVETATR